MVEEVGYYPNEQLSTASYVTQCLNGCPRRSGGNTDSAPQSWCSEVCYYWIGRLGRNPFLKLFMLLGITSPTCKESHNLVSEETLTRSMAEELAHRHRMTA